MDQDLWNYKPQVNFSSSKLFLLGVLVRAMKKSTKIDYLWDWFLKKQKQQKNNKPQDKQRPFLLSQTLNNVSYVNLGFIMEAT